MNIMHYPTQVARVTADSWRRMAVELVARLHGLPTPTPDHQEAEILQALSPAQHQQWAAQFQQHLHQAQQLHQEQLHTYGVTDDLLQRTAAVSTVTVTTALQVNSVIMPSRWRRPGTGS